MQQLGKSSSIIWHSLHAGTGIQWHPPKAQHGMSPEADFLFYHQSVVG